MGNLVVGGSFNPIHHGHLLCARAAAEAAGLSGVVLMPSRSPPHKPNDPDLASAQDRLAMCRVAVAGVAAFTVDDREMRRTGPSYTIDTVRELRREGWPAVHWMIGADMLLILPTWRQARELMEEANFVIVARPGWTIDWNQLPEPFRRLRENVVTAPLIDISATDIRRRVAAGQSIDFLTPPAVVDYIRSRAVYREPST